MGDEGEITNLEEQWREFLVTFHANTEAAKKRIRKVDLLPEKNAVCFVLYEAFSGEECQFLIDGIEKIGFSKLLYGEDYRTNTRTQITQKSLADEFFFRVQEYLPPRWPGFFDTSHWEVSNLNERIRICKYEPGQFFVAHYDGVFKRSQMEQSQMTIMVYLNDEFTGGHTNFLDERSKPPALTYALKPETGMVLIFQHDMFHEGEALTSGKKYIMRSDVMYRRVLLKPMSEKELQARELIVKAEQLEDQSNAEEAVQCYRKAYKLWPALEQEFGK